MDGDAKTGRIVAVYCRSPLLYQAQSRKTLSSWILQLVVLALLSSFSLVQARAEDSPELLEARVKAVCIYNFAKYIKWPEAAFSAADSPIQMCTVGTHPVGDILKDANGKSAQNRTVVSKTILESDLDAAKHCHILFYGSTADRSQDKIEKALKGSSVLTVSENSGVGMVNFVLENGKVRFEIDVGRSKDAGFVISSQLLKLAIVKGDK